MAATPQRWLMEGCKVWEVGLGHNTRGMRRQGKKDGTEQRCVFMATPPRGRYHSGLLFCARFLDLPPTYLTTSLGTFLTSKPPVSPPTDPKLSLSEDPL